MKKLIIILVVVFCALFLGAPYFTGKVAQTETLKLVEQINQSPTQYGSVKVSSYDRSWRSSKASYAYTPPVALAELSNDAGEIVVACENSHGITGIDYTCALDSESPYGKFVAEKLDGKDPLSVFGSVSAFGGITQTVALDEIKDVDVDGVVLNLPKAQISVDTDLDGSNFKIDGGSDAFNMQGNGNDLSVGEMTIEGDFEKVVGSLFTGDMLMTLDHMNMVGPLGETSFKGLSMLSNASENGDTLSSEVMFSAKEIISAGLPFNTVENVDFGLDFAGLDKQSFLDYQEYAQRLQRESLNSLGNRAEPQLNPAEIMPILEGMLREGLEINSKINAKLDNKPNNIALDIKLLDSLTLAQMSQFMANPDESLKKLDVSLDASLDKSLVDAQPMAAAFIGQSPLVAAGSDNYSLDLKLGENIELNGKKMSFSELQVLVFSSLPF